jgi:hypothetical protein
MRKLCLSLAAIGAISGLLSPASAFEAMVGRNYGLHNRPHSRHHFMTLINGDIVGVSACNHGWCAVTHGPHAGYIHVRSIVDDRVYGPYGGVWGYRNGGPALIGAVYGYRNVAAPLSAGDDVLTPGVSFLR